MRVLPGPDWSRVVWLTSAFSATEVWPTISRPLQFTDISSVAQMRKYSVSTDFTDCGGNFVPPVELLCQHDILRCPKYVHRRSHRNKFYIKKDGKAIPSMRSVYRCHSKSSDRWVNPSVLTSLPRSEMHLNQLKFGLYNIWSLTNKWPYCRP